MENFEPLGKEIQFTRICGDATFIHGVAVGRCCRTVADVDDGFGDRTPACREYTREPTIFGPVSNSYYQVSGNYGIEFQIPFTTVKERKSWVVICRGKNRFVEELPHLEPGPNPTS